MFNNELWQKPAGGAGGDFYDYQIAKSVRIPANSSTSSSNGRLTKTFSTVDSSVHWTLNFWIKRAAIGGTNPVSSARPLTWFTPRNGTSGSVLNEFKFCSPTAGNTAGDSLMIVQTNSNAIVLSTDNLFRDTSAWYNIHIQADLDNGTNSERLKFFINGTEASYNTDNRGSYTSLSGITAGAWTIGDYYNYGYPIQSYFAQWAYVDGYTHPPTDFGESKNGVWIPKDLSSGITWGSAGHLLDFADSSALGNDVSGNNNDWTTANIDTHDQMLDSPTFGSSSNGGNFPTWNWLVYSTNFRNGMNPSYGNTRSNPNNPCIGFSTMAMTTGKKWYIEAYAISTPCTIGIFSLDSYATKNNFNANYHNTDGIFWHSNGQLYIESNLSSSTTSYNSGDVVAFAVDLESTTETVKFYKNGSLQTTKNIPSGFLNRDWFFSLSRPTGGGGYIMNAGQDSTFAGTISAGGNSDDNGFGDFKYSVPSGYLALCSGNLGISDDIDPAQTDDNYPQKQFNALLYTGDGGSSRAITGLGFQPDFVWIKRRNASENHNLYDSTRGVNKRIQSNRDVAETTEGLPAFGSDGFTVDASGGICNVSSQTYVAWNWRANGGTTSTNSSGSISVTQQVDPSGGFSISTYSGTAGTPTIGHGLSSAPTFVIVKQTNGTHNWAVYAAGAGATKYGFLESTSGFGTDNMWGNTSPTDTLVYLGAYTQTSGSGRNYVAYCFADTEGYIKSGSYEGNGNVDGAFIYTGFKPAFILIKGIDANGTGWNLHDNATSPFNVASTALQANTASAELSNYNIDMLSNGFKVRDADGDLGTNNNTYIYLAFASNPFKYATAR